MPKALKALQPTSNYVNSSGLDRSLLEVIKMRTSELSGCAYCIDMHTKDAHVAGETEQRLYLLDAWRETSLYTERERAAFEWRRGCQTLQTPMYPTRCLPRSENAIRTTSW